MLPAFSFTIADKPCPDHGLPWPYKGTCGGFHLYWERQYKGRTVRSWYRLRPDGRWWPCGSGGRS